MRRVRAMLLGCMLGCAGLPAFAQSDVIKPGEETITIGLGWVFNSFGTNLRVDNQGSQGSNVNLKDDFGVNKDESSYWASFEWRFAKRHRIGISNSAFKLSGTRTATRNIQIGDETFPAGATLTSELKINVIPVTYSYSLFKSDQDEFAATLGVHWSSIKFKASGSASLNGQDANADVTASVDAPLPLIGLRYDHHFSQRWSMGLHGAIFKVKVGNVDGDLWSARAEGEYRFSRHLGLGLALEGFGLDVKASDSSWNGEIKYDYWGPQVYLKARF
jgi:hypothetical protein